MRGSVLSIVLLASGLLAPGEFLVPDALAAGGPAAAEGRGSPTVRFGGLELPVPRGWAVHDLAAEPGRCVRFDEHAIYLGLPVGEPDCPTRIVGRTEAVHLTPIKSEPGERRMAVRRRLSSLRVGSAVSHEVRMDFPEAGVRITGT